MLTVGKFSISYVAEDGSQKTAEFSTPAELTAFIATLPAAVTETPAKRGRRHGVQDLWKFTRGPRVGALTKLGEREMAKPAAKRGKRWRAEIIDDAGKTEREHFHVKKDAQDWLDIRVGKMVANDGLLVLARGSEVTVGSYIDSWRKGYHAPAKNSRRNVDQRIRIIKQAAFANYTLKDLKTSDIREWVVHLQTVRITGGRTGYSAIVIQKLLRLLRSILDTAVDDRLIPANPAKNVRGPQVSNGQKKVLTPANVQRGYEVCRPDNLKVAIILAAFVGLRADEVCGLRREDVDIPGCRIRVEVQGSEDKEGLKTEGSHAWVPIHPSAMHAIARSMELWPGNTVVTDGFGGPVKYHLLGGPSGMIDRIKRDARELPEWFLMKSLRVFYGTAMILEGRTLPEVQRLLRHRKGSTTWEAYIGLWEEAERLDKPVAETFDFGILGK